MKVREEEIKEKLLSFSNGEEFRNRILKSGPFRKKAIRIYEPVNHASGFRADQIAFFLTDYILPDNIDECLQTVIILNERVTYKEYLLTHIYLKEEKLLAFYKYPNRLNFPQKKMAASRFTDSVQSYPGILSFVFQKICETNNPFEKFLIPYSLIEDHEV